MPEEYVNIHARNASLTHPIQAKIKQPVISDQEFTEVKEKLENVNAGDETVETFISTLNDIEFARFAPGSAKDKMENIYTKALEAILKAEKAIK